MGAGGGAGGGAGTIGNTHEQSVEDPGAVATGAVGDAKVSGGALGGPTVGPIAGPITGSIAGSMGGSMGGGNTFCFSALSTDSSGGCMGCAGPAAGPEGSYKKPARARRMYPVLIPLKTMHMVGDCSGRVSVCPSFIK